MMRAIDLRIADSKEFVLIEPAKEGRARYNLGRVDALAESKFWVVDEAKVVCSDNLK